MIGIWIAATVETRITQNGPKRLVFIDVSQWSIADGSGFNEKKDSNNNNNNDNNNNINNNVIEALNNHSDICLLV